MKEIMKMTASAKLFLAHENGGIESGINVASASEKSENEERNGISEIA
jgi:hypothetical protein